MAYTKTDWACGDKITAEKLNKIEQGIVDAQNGYECTTTRTVFFENTGVTVEVSSGDDRASVLLGSQFLDADSIVLTVNGVEYEYDKVVKTGLSGSYNAYGKDDANPFWLESDFSDETPRLDFYVRQSGTYNIKIETVEESATTTPCFEKAVESVVGGASGALIVKYDHDSDGQQYYDKTWQQVKDAFDAGLPIYLHLEGVSSDTRQYFDHLSFKSGSLAVTFDDFSGGNTQLLAENVNGFLYKSSIS